MNSRNRAVLVTFMQKLFRLCSSRILETNIYLTKIKSAVFSTVFCIYSSMKDTHSTHTHIIQTQSLCCLTISKVK